MFLWTLTNLYRYYCVMLMSRYAWYKAYQASMERVYKCECSAAIHGTHVSAQAPASHFTNLSSVSNNTEFVMDFFLFDIFFSKALICGLIIIVIITIIKHCYVVRTRIQIWEVGIPLCMLVSLFSLCSC